MHLVVTAPEHPGAPSLPWFQSVAGLAERGGFDAVLFRAGAIDPMPLLPMLAGSTRRVGLGGEIALDWAEPFNVARSFAGTDRLTAGRTAWLTGVAGPERRPQFGHAPALPAADRYARAEEAIVVVRKLWDSWEDEAVILDKAAGLFSDAGRVHRINHVGPWFTVRGPLNAPRPLQGYPVVVMDDESEAGLRLAYRAADVLLARDAGAAMATLGGRVRVLQTVALAADAAAQLRAMAAQVAAGGCHGFNLTPETADDFAAFVAQMVARPYAHATLRENLGLVRPRSQFAA